jgi:inner membrane protein
MASAITHFIVAAALAAPASESRSLQRVLPRWGIPVSCGLVAVFPDFDTITMRALGIPYRSFLGHRGFFHSPFFLILFSALIATLVAWRFGRAVILRLTLIWACAAITHPLLDMLTDGGAGVMLLFPFSKARLFFPWRPIHASPLEISRFFGSAGYILRSELPFCIAATAIGLGGWAATAAMRPLATQTQDEYAGWYEVRPPRHLRMPGAGNRPGFRSRRRSR